MAEQTILTKFKLRHDIASNWTTKNPVLLEGEIGFETDTLNFKVGNGSSNWNSLKYYIPDTSKFITEDKLPDTSNFITINTEQTITGYKTFDNLVKVMSTVLDKDGGVLAGSTDNLIQLANQNKALLIGCASRPSIVQGITNEKMAYLSDLDKIYPVGSIYLTTKTDATGSISPASFLGGTWERLPEGYALWTASSNAGTTISAGLPNITGTLGLLNHPETNTRYEGAFSQSGSASNTHTAMNSNNRTYTNAYFDANNGCATKGIYRDDVTTVQPPAYRVYAWERIS